MDALIFKIGIFIVLFVVGWAFGRHVEYKHLRELEEKKICWHILLLIISAFIPP